jgi:hypothetical protein
MRAVPKDAVANQRSIDHRRCGCCDGETVSVRGTISSAGRTLGVYFATFTIRHDGIVRLAIGVNDPQGPEVPFALVDVWREGSTVVVEPPPMRIEVDEDEASDVVEPVTTFPPSTTIVHLAEVVALTDPLIARHLEHAAAARWSGVRELAPSAPSLRTAAKKARG